MSRGLVNRRLRLAESIMREPWTDGPDPPPRERGSERERRQLRLPPWMWADVDEIARASGLSRDEVVSLVLYRWLRDASLHGR